MTEASEQFVDVKTTARRFGVSPKTVRRWLLSGRLRGVRLGSGPGRIEWRVPESALRDFTASLPTNRAEAEAA